MKKKDKKALIKKSKESYRLNRSIQKRDKAIDDWIDEALSSSPYTRDLIFRCVGHVIAKQNEDIRASIDENYNDRG